MDPATSTVLSVIGIALGAIILLGAVIVWMKGRPFAQGEVFRASRLSKSNHLLPTQVFVSPTSVIHYTPQWFGKYEHSIHMAHVASVGIDTHMIFSNVLIETTGGASAIHCKGHYKSHAVRMKRLIEQYQTAYFKGAHAPDALLPGH
jgi:hypothetical protein